LLRKGAVKRMEPGFIPQVPEHAMLRCIGRGSYGEVWLARTVIGKYRAIKIVYRGTFKEDRPYEREFSGIRRFEPLSRMHEGFVDILQVGRNDQAGYYYYVMELADDRESGQQVDAERYQPNTLDKVVGEKGRLSIDCVLKLGLSLTSALGYLHEKGLLHRDIKPSNIVLVNGVAKISDVGLVAEMGAPGTFVGTEGYIPPEGPGTAQADIYSLGKVLYEISTGHDRHNYPALPDRLEEEKDRSQLLELNDVVVKACENDWRQRYQSMGEMHEDLLLLDAGKSVRRLRLLERRMKLLTRAGLVSCSLLMLFAGAWHHVDRSAKREAEVRSRQVGSYVASGAQNMEQGDLFGSLPWFAKALQLDQGLSEREAPHRIRFAATLQQCPKIVRMFSNGSPLNFAELSPEGDLFVSASQAGDVTLYSQADGAVLGHLAGHSAEVQTARFSPDGRYIVTASLDGTARVWEAKSLREVPSASPLEHRSPVNSAKFDSVGDRIVTGCENGVVTVWEMGSKAKLLEFMAHREAVLDASFNPEGTLIVTASHDETARIWRASSGQPFGGPLPHEGWVFQASFSPDGRLVATADFDRAARVWDLKLGLQIAVLSHDGPVRSAQFSPDGRYLVTGSWDDYAIRIWDLATHRLAGPPMRHSGNVMHAAFSVDGRRIASAGYDRTARLWDLAPSRWLPPGSTGVLLLSRSCSVKRAGDVLQVCPVPGTCSVELPLSGHSPSLALLSGDSTKVITITGGLAGRLKRHSLVQIWDQVTGLPAWPAFASEDPLTNVLTSRDGKRIASITANGVQIWNTVTGMLLSQIPPDAAASGGAFTPDGTELALRKGDTVRFYRTETGLELRSFQHPSTVRHVEFSPDARHLVSACCEDQNVVAPREALVWDFSTGRATALKHRDGVLHASFSPDGKRVVTASEDRYAQVWQTATGAAVGRVLNHKHHVTYAAFSPDGRWVLTVCRDRTTRVWDAETGDPLTPPLQDVEALREAHFSQDGRSVQTLSFRGTLRGWRLTEAAGTVQMLGELADLLSGNQSTQAGGANPDAKGSHESWTKLSNLTVSAEEIAVWQEREGQKLEEWHQQQALDCEEKEQWFAALFHIGQLLALNPENPELLERRLRAQVRWATALAAAW
jgi:WD40 repeat protein